MLNPGAPETKPNLLGSCIKHNILIMTNVCGVLGPFFSSKRSVV